MSHCHLRTRLDAIIVHVFILYYGSLLAEKSCVVWYCGSTVWRQDQGKSDIWSRTSHCLKHIHCEIIKYFLVRHQNLATGLEHLRAIAARGFGCRIWKKENLKIFRLFYWTYIYPQCIPDKKLVCQFVAVQNLHMKIWKSRLLFSNNNYIGETQFLSLLILKEAR